MLRHIRLANKKIQKCQKLKNYPIKPKNPKSQKSNKDYASELMLKTINVHTHEVSKQKNSKMSITKKLPLKPPKPIIKEGVLQ